MKKIILILLLIITGCSLNNTKVDNPIVNNSIKIMEEQIINECLIKPEYLIYENGMSILSLKITNLMDKQNKIENLEIKFYLENGSLITSIQNNNNYILAPNSTINIIINSDLDLTNISYIEYKAN